ERSEERSGVESSESDAVVVFAVQCSHFWMVRVPRWAEALTNTKQSVISARPRAERGPSRGETDIFPERVSPGFRSAGQWNGGPGGRPPRTVFAFGLCIRWRLNGTGTALRKPGESRGDSPSIRRALVLRRSAVVSSGRAH